MGASFQSIATAVLLLGEDVTTDRDWAWRCVSCGYLLKGLGPRETVTCPECGTVNHEIGPRRSARRRMVLSPMALRLCCLHGLMGLINLLMLVGFWSSPVWGGHWLYRPHSNAIAALNVWANAATFLAMGTVVFGVVLLVALARKKHPIAIYVWTAVGVATGILTPVFGH